MSKNPTWQSIIASSVDWHEAHAPFEHVTSNMPAAQRGRRPENFPHSAWELVEHIRRAQADIVEFMGNPDYKALKWPDDYWPPTPAPPSDAAWNESIAAVRRDGERLKAIATRDGLDLTSRIPWGDGQNYLRTILVSVVHTSHHTGQLIAVRRLLGVWPPQ
jgi:uncharacterized damage-inducible protein DinB